jgi:glycerate dehydrogenase
MANHSIVFLDSSTLDAGDISFDRLSSLGALTLHPTTAPHEVAERISGSEIVITNKVVLDRANIAGAPALRLIVVAATGYNNVDLAAASESGIPVCNVAGYSSATVAQHTIALLLNLATNVHRFAAEAEAWSRSPIFTRLDYPVTELAGKTLGIAGLGDIGSRVGVIAAALGMKIHVLGREGSSNPRHPEWPRVERETFFRESDAVTLHCPLTSDTENLINADTLALMKPTAIVLNTGRGPLVDEPSLLEALRSKRLAGAGLDVLRSEPPAPDQALLAAAATLPNLLVTPHTAWTSREARIRLLDGVTSNVEAFLNGTPTNVVNALPR